MNPQQHVDLLYEQWFAKNKKQKKTKKQTYIKESRQHQSEHILLRAVG